MGSQISLLEIFFQVNIVSGDNNLKPVPGQMRLDRQGRAGIEFQCLMRAPEDELFLWTVAVKCKIKTPPLFTPPHSPHPLRVNYVMSPLAVMTAIIVACSSFNLSHELTAEQHHGINQF